MMHLHDVVIPIVTPLTEDDRVCTRSLTRLTEYLIEKHVDCLYPCGTTGEMVYFTDEERMLVVDTVIRAANGRIPVFAQVGAANTESTIRLAQHAQKAGADGIGVVTPWYFNLTDDALVEFYCSVAESVPEDFPVYLYSIPQNAVNDITAPVAQRIAERCPNVLGIKYSYPDMTRIQELMTVRGGTFDVLVGPDHLYEAVTAVGGTGVVSGNAMIIPEHYGAIRDAMARGDWDKATRLQRRTNCLNGILCAKNNISAYKEVLKRAGVIETARMRRPMVELSEADREGLFKALDENDYQNVRI